MPSVELAQNHTLSKVGILIEWLIAANTSSSVFDRHTSSDVMPNTISVAQLLPKPHLRNSSPA